ncbi:MAG: UDP-N-acetylmuramoyl-tripeptide--D-alanyl-D-alanine ligase [Candidatus Margulisiibacteriota bacterium]
MFTYEEVIKITKAKGIIGPRLKSITKISIDSRTLKPAELFIPIKGKRYDGAAFIPEALKKGGVVLKVKDGLKALQKLAAYHRSKFKIPIIGVTGSCGKTTTKDMIASILSQEMPTLKNEENYNNEIGVPLTLLKLTKRHKAAIIEMAMQRLGEIKELAKICKPTIAVVTNIGEAHLAFLKSKKNIAKAKSEIFYFLKRGDFAVINQDDEYFEHLKSKAKRKGAKIITFGLLEKAEVTPKELRGIKLPIPGEHNIYNALAAIAVAKILKIKKSSIKKGLETFNPSSHRMHLIDLPRGIRIIDDTYNANPSSMAAALKTLAHEFQVSGRKIAVLGDMLELGRSTKAAHRRILKLAQDLKIDKIFTIGKCWPNPSFKDQSKLLKNLKNFLKPHDIILFKGSRGMHLDAAVVELADTYV